MKGALARKGYVCDEAAGGHEALALARVNQYDAIITDLKMPGMNGHTVCVELMGLPQPPPIIVVTAMNDRRLEVDLRSRGVADILIKPIDYWQFAAQVDAALQQCASREREATPSKTCVEELPAVKLETKAARSAEIEAPADALRQADEGRSSPKLPTRLPLPQPDNETTAVKETANEVLLAHDFLAPVIPSPPPKFTETAFWPTAIFAMGTGFGWALHLISTSVLSSFK